jgi:hypothetical protein
VFWVAACAGIIVFGSLMGAMFVGQQFLQDVLAYSTFDAGVAILPAAFLMVIVAPRSAKVVEAKGARFTLLTGYAFCLLGFLTMLLLWGEGSPYWEVGLGYALIGVGVGFAGTPASHSLTGSVPVERAGMASGTADLQRDLGGAIMQSIFGALLAAGYAASFTSAIAASPNAQKVSTASRRSSPSRSRAPRPSPSSTRSTRTRSPRRRRRRSCRATSGRTSRASWRSARRGARLLRVPEEGGRAAAPRRVPTRGLVVRITRSRRDAAYSLDPVSATILPLAAASLSA